MADASCDGGLVWGESKQSIKMCPVHVPPAVDLPFIWSVLQSRHNRHPPSNSYRQCRITRRHNGRVHLFDHVVDRQNTPQHCRNSSSPAPHVERASYGTCK